MPDTTSQPPAPINWNNFTETLENDVLAAQLSHSVLALIIVHVQQLPFYNFRLGFRGGEAIIAHVMGQLRSTLSRATRIERIAPDRVGVIITEVEVPELLSLSARKIINHLAAPLTVGDEIISVAATVGISIFPEHADSAEALISEAELSLRAVDDNARPFHIPVAARSEEHLTVLQMGDDLQHAIADERLTLHYQPKVDLHSRRPVAAETLMRWTTAEGRRISPDLFIPVAEASGSIFRLTEWAVNTALREGGEINGSCDAYGVAVNLSAKTIYDPALIHIVESALAIWDLAPEHLTLEVTESSLMKDPKACFKNLSRIRDQGVRISIDDFGTGFSSLSYFKAIPADEIKIDQSFVRNMADHDADAKLVGLIIDLARTFGLHVVAEGIETDVTAARLQDMGCDVGQGFLFAPAMDLDTYCRWLEPFQTPCPPPRGNN